MHCCSSMNAIFIKHGKSVKVTSESFNTSLLDNLTTAVIVLDKASCLFHMNPAAESLLETSDRHSHMAHITELVRNGEVLELKGTAAMVKNIERHFIEVDTAAAPSKVALRNAVFYK